MIRRPGRLALDAVTGCVVLFLIGPLLIIIGASFTTTPYLTFPPRGLTLHWYRELANHLDLLHSFVTSLIVACGAGIAATVIGTATAFALNQDEAVWRERLRAFAISPLVLPTIVTGVALYSFLQVVNIGATYFSLIVGHTVITVPYVVRTVGAALTGLDPSLAEAASGLGARDTRVFREVVLPAIAPAMLVSLLLVFIVSFDQVSLSIFLASPTADPLPVRLYSYLEFGLDPMVGAASALMIGFAYALVLLVEHLVGVDRLFARGAE